jgi:hypothetical protein
MARYLVSTFLIALMAREGACEPRIPVAVIGSGSSVVVDTSPQKPLINVRIDIGTLRQIGDAIEAEMTWTLRLGRLADEGHHYPDAPIPEGSAYVERTRTICRPHGPLAYLVETRIVAPDGNLVAKQAYDADVEREKAEKPPNGWPRTDTPGYIGDLHSLVCWVAARKCEDKDFTWPPPPNDNNTFIPRCRLPDHVRSE